MSRSWSRGVGCAVGGDERQRAAVPEDVAAPGQDATKYARRNRRRRRHCLSVSATSSSGPRVTPPHGLLSALSAPARAEHSKHLHPCRPGALGLEPPTDGVADHVCCCTRPLWVVCVKSPILRFPLPRPRARRVVDNKCAREARWAPANRHRRQHQHPAPSSLLVHRALRTAAALSPNNHGGKPNSSSPPPLSLSLYTHTHTYIHIHRLHAPPPRVHHHPPRFLSTQRHVCRVAPLLHSPMHTCAMA